VTHFLKSITRSKQNINVGSVKRKMMRVQWVVDLKWHETHESKVGCSVRPQFDDKRVET